MLNSSSVPFRSNWAVKGFWKSMVEAVRINAREAEDCGRTKRRKKNGGGALSEGSGMQNWALGMKGRTKDEDPLPELEEEVSQDSPPVMHRPWVRPVEVVVSGRVVKLKVCEGARHSSDLGTELHCVYFLGEGLTSAKEEVEKVRRKREQGKGDTRKEKEEREREKKTKKKKKKEEDESDGGNLGNDQCEEDEGEEREEKEKEKQEHGEKTVMKSEHTKEEKKKRKKSTKTQEEDNTTQREKGCKQSSKRCVAKRRSIHQSKKSRLKTKPKNKHKTQQHKRNNKPRRAARQTSAA